MTEAPLLAAILADPDDDAPRLIYADWLDENGRGERAEFVRIQMELARHPEGVRYVEHFPPGKWQGQPFDKRHFARLDALRRRERELLGDHTTASNYAAWAGPLLWNLSVGSSRSPAEFRRGFVESVTCSAADWLVHADAILAAQPVQEATLTTLPGHALMGGRWQIDAGWDKMGYPVFCGEAEAVRMTAIICAGRWRGVRFTLPPTPHPIYAIPPEVARAIGDSYEAGG